MGFKHLGFLSLLAAVGVIIFAIQSGFLVRRVDLPGGAGVEFDPPITRSPERQTEPSPQVEPAASSSLPEPPQALDISGAWQGTLYQQNPNGTILSYSYSLDLTQNGNSIGGIARLQVPPPYGYYIVMKIRGSFSRDVLDFNDSLVIANVAPPGWFWCQKSVRLTSIGATFQGTWTASGCGSGRIALSR